MWIQVSKSTQKRHKCGFFRNIARRKEPGYKYPLSSKSQTNFKIGIFYLLVFLKFSSMISIEMLFGSRMTKMHLDSISKANGGFNGFFPLVRQTSCSGA